MKQTLIQKIYEMPCVRRQILFGGVQFLYRTVHSHSPEADLNSFCKLYKFELEGKTNLNPHEITELYVFARDHDRESNLYKAFRDEYLCKALEK